MACRPETALPQNGGKIKTKEPNNRLFCFIKILITLIIK